MACRSERPSGRTSRGHLGREDDVAQALPGLEAPVPDGFTCTMDDDAGWLTAGVEAVAGQAGPGDLVDPEGAALRLERFLKEVA